MTLGILQKGAVLNLSPEGATSMKCSSDSFAFEEKQIMYVTSVSAEGQTSKTYIENPT